MSIITNSGVSLPDIPTDTLSSYPYAAVLETTTLFPGERSYIMVARSAPSVFVPADLATQVVGELTNYIMPQDVMAGMVEPFALLDIESGTWGAFPEEMDEWEAMSATAMFSVENDGFSGGFLAWSNFDVKKATNFAPDTYSFVVGNVVVYAATSETEEKKFAVTKQWLQQMADATRSATGTPGGKTTDAIKSTFINSAKNAIAFDELGWFLANNQSAGLALHLKAETYPDAGKTMLPDAMIDYIGEIIAPNLVETPSQWLQNGGGYDATNLLVKEVHLQTATKINHSSFSGQTKLEKVIAPNATQIGSEAFERCSSITEITREWFPEVTRTEMYAFSDCTNLIRADFPKLANCGQCDFAYSGLKTLVLRNTSRVCYWNMNGKNNLAETPIGNGKGVVLVPASLVSAYKGDSTWGTLADSQILPLETYTVDGTVNGDVDWNKVENYISML